MVSKEAVLNCFHDWIDRYGYEHTADEDLVYQRIEALDAVRRCDEDCISRRVAIDAIDDIESEVADGFGFQYEKWREYFCELPAVQPDHNADVGKKVADEDCISRRVAIEAIDEWFKKVRSHMSAYEYDSAYAQGEIDAYVTAIDTLKTLAPIQPEPKWIPCDERLPEYNESVLTWDGYVFCIEKRIPYIRDDDGEPIEGDWWVGDEYDDYESECYPNLRDGAAIAWLSLPEPYNGGDAE